MSKVSPIKIFSFLSLLGLSVVLAGCTPHQQGSFESAETSYDRHDYSRAFSELWVPVQHHDAKAEYAMGYMYYYGVGTEKDQDLGRSLIRRSAIQGYQPAIQALKLIMARRHTQYVPFEEYPRSVRKEGIWEIKKPLIQGKHA